MQDGDFGADAFSSDLLATAWSGSGEDVPLEDALEALSSSSPLVSTAASSPTGTTLTDLTMPTSHENIMIQGQLALPVIPPPLLPLPNPMPEPTTLEATVSDPTTWAVSMKVPKNRRWPALRLRPDRDAFATPEVIIPGAEAMGLNLFDPQHRPRVMFQCCASDGSPAANCPQNFLIEGAETFLSVGANSFTFLPDGGLSVKIPLLFKTSCFKAGCASFRLVVYIPAVENWTIASTPFIAAFNV